MPTLVDIERLQTIQHFADAYPGRGKVGVSVGYIYKLINSEKLGLPVHVIDGMKFIELPSPLPPSAP